jgi:hypothetical protein
MPANFDWFNATKVAEDEHAEYRVSPIFTVTSSKNMLQQAIAGKAKDTDEVKVIPYQFPRDLPDHAEMMNKMQARQLEAIKLYCQPKGKLK